MTSVKMLQATSRISYVTTEALAMTAQIGIQYTATLSVLSVGQTVKTNVHRGLIIMSCLLLRSLDKV